jgi:DNA modification methylase
MKNLEEIRNQILNGDCIDLAKQIPDDSVDLTVFSPPYDSIRDYKKNWSFDFLGLGKELYRDYKRWRRCSCGDWGRDKKLCKVADDISFGGFVVR